MPLVGLTGGMATGKSLVSSMFVKLGAKLLDCDVLAREVIEPGAKGLKLVVKEFGDGILRSGGYVNRKALGDLVFADPGRRKTLEGILHPIIEKLVDTRSKQMFSSDPGAVIIVDAALLFESGLYRRMDKNIAVVCDPKAQMERAILRGVFTEAQINSRIEAQWPLTEKAKMADYVIDNSGPPEGTLKQVTAVWDRIKKSK